MPFRDIHRAALTSIIAAAITLGPALDAGQTGVQSVQYRSPEGVEYRSLPETDAVKSARAALEANPRNMTRIIDLGVAQSGARQFREAIATFTQGLEIEPNNALLLRWRGHRYLSVREFDRAFADLTRGGTIDSEIYGIWYHLGVVQYLRGDFAEAAASFAKAQPIAPDAGELAGSTDWLWMSLSRAGRGAEAKAMLASSASVFRMVLGLANQRTYLLGQSHKRCTDRRICYSCGSPIETAIEVQDTDNGAIIFARCAEHRL
jgi:tetratricopeptide (TPR) repeat protein